MEHNEILAKWAQKGAALGDCGRMCTDCAFKLGTEANSDSFVTDTLVFWQLDTEKPFYCHHAPGIVNLERVCAGHLYAKQYLKSLEKK